MLQLLLQLVGAKSTIQGGQGQSCDLAGDDFGRIRTSSEVRGTELVDLSVTDVVYVAPLLPKLLMVGVAGVVKVDCYARDGFTLQSGVLITVPANVQLALPGITKIYKTGTTATGLVAVF